MELQLYVLKRDLKVVCDEYENMRKNEERAEYRVKNLKGFVKRFSFRWNLNRFTKINLFRFRFTVWDVYENMRENEERAEYIK